MINQDSSGNLFGKWEIAKNTWCITNRWSNFMYLLIGEEKALLIDSGTGEGNIRKFVEQITDKPIMVVNTHGHFDHTGGNFWWEEVWMHRESEECARNAFNDWGEDWLKDKDYPNYKINYLKEGDVIELGNRKVKVLHIPAHNEGSIAFIDDFTRGLFCGDELESGQVLLFVRNENIPLKEVAANHRANMERLKSMRQEYDMIWPSHNGLPLLPDRYLEDFITLDSQIIEGTAKVCENTGGFGWGTGEEKNEFFERFGELERVNYGVASVVYQKEI
ncbi:MAG: MBL fold metallo-hydrolase [Lachnospiraceae bacterium]|nr:MBL fold metallo-hydrolase [Lachnospiraceae bacterium]